MDLAGTLRSAWGLRDARIEPLGGGMNSETWTVRGAGSTYVAKRVAPDDVEALARGCAAASMLAEAGLVTGRRVPTLDGRLLDQEARLALLVHVPGIELSGDGARDQETIATTLASVHAAGSPSSGPGTSGFFSWLGAHSPGVAAHLWLDEAVSAARAECDVLPLTWSLLHTDPAPEAFRHDPDTGVTGLIDWAGAARGPVLYDVASAVMYLGGPPARRPFHRRVRGVGPLAAVELGHLDALRRFRWAVQGAYFARRLLIGDLTGIGSASENEKGLADARRGLRASSRMGRRAPGRS